MKIVPKASNEFFTREKSTYERKVGPDLLGAAWLSARRLAVRQARVRILTRASHEEALYRAEENKSGTRRVAYINIVCMLD